MISEALQFWNSVSGKIAGLIRNETKNAFRCERYEVTTAPNGTQIGVTLPYGSNQLFIPYSKEVATASVGDTVLVVWWGSMSNAKAYYFANGYEGTESAAGGGVIATITIPLAWNDSGNGYHTATPTITGAAVSSNSKITLQPTASMQLQLRSSGVESLYVENNSGTMTAYAVGNAPTTALSMQCTVAETEGAQSGNAVIGDTTTVPGARTLLWENSSPAASFAAQTVTLSDSIAHYDFLFIEYLFGTSVQRYYSKLVLTSGFPSNAIAIDLAFNSGAANRTGSREATIETTTTITFGSGAYNGSTSNAYGIPTAIYGLKM